MKLTTEELIEHVRRVNDPELRLSIVDLGLVYDAHSDDDGNVVVTMTLTSPGCPVGPLLIGTVQDVLMEVPGVRDVDVDLTFSPPWDPRTMASDEIKMQLGIW
jgi:metal-sulfur cluster biosynthetic enzyme